MFSSLLTPGSLGTTSSLLSWYPSSSTSRGCWRGLLYGTMRVLPINLQTWGFHRTTSNTTGESQGGTNAYLACRNPNFRILNITFSALLPFLFIFFLNARILWDLRHVKVSWGRDHRCHFLFRPRGLAPGGIWWRKLIFFWFCWGKEKHRPVSVLIILCSIVVTFLLLHTPRIIVDIYEFLNIEVTKISSSVLLSHWSRNVEAWLSLVERFRVLLRQLSDAIRAPSNWFFLCMEATYHALRCVVMA